MVVGAAAVLVVDSLYDGAIIDGPSVRQTGAFHPAHHFTHAPTFRNYHRGSGATFPYFHFSLFRSFLKIFNSPGGINKKKKLTNS